MMQICQQATGQLIPGHVTCILNWSFGRGIVLMVSTGSLSKFLTKQFSIIWTLSSADRFFILLKEILQIWRLIATT